MKLTARGASPDRGSAMKLATGDGGSSIVAVAANVAVAGIVAVAVKVAVACGKASATRIWRAYRDWPPGPSATSSTS